MADLEQHGGGAKRLLHQFQEQFRARPLQQRQCRVRGHVGERLPPVLQDTSTGAVMSSLDSYMSAFTPLDECTALVEAPSARSTAAATNEQFVQRMDTLIGVAKRADDAAQEGSQFCSQYSNAAAGLLPCFETHQRNGDTDLHHSHISSQTAHRIPRRTSLPPPSANGDQVPGSGDDESSSLLMIPTEVSTTATRQRLSHELPTTVRLIKDLRGGDKSDDDAGEGGGAAATVVSNEEGPNNVNSLGDDDEDDESSSSSYAATVVQEDENNDQDDHGRPPKQQHGVGSTSLLSSRYDRRLNDVYNGQASEGERCCGGVNEFASARQGAQLTAWETPPLPTASTNSWEDHHRPLGQQHRLFEPPPGSYTTAIDGQLQRLPFSPRPCYREQHLPLRDSEWGSTILPIKNNGALSPTQHRQIPRARIARGCLGKLPAYPYGVDPYEPYGCPNAAVVSTAAGGVVAGGCCWHRSPVGDQKRRSTPPTCGHAVAAAAVDRIASRAEQPHLELYTLMAGNALTGDAVLSPHDAERGYSDGQPPPPIYNYSFARYALPGGKRRRTTTGGSGCTRGQQRPPPSRAVSTHISAAAAALNEPITTSTENELAKKRNRGLVKPSAASTVQQRSLSSETPDSTVATRFCGGGGSVVRAGNHHSTAVYEPSASTRRSNHLYNNSSERVIISTTGVGAVPSGRVFHPGRATSTTTTAQGRRDTTILPASTPPPHVWEAIGITPQTTAAPPVMYRVSDHKQPTVRDNPPTSKSGKYESPVESNAYTRHSLKKDMLPTIARPVCTHVSEMASTDRGGRNILGRLFKTLASPRVTHR